MKTKNFVTLKMKISKIIFFIVTICISLLGAPTYVSAIAATPLPQNILPCDFIGGCYTPGWGSSWNSTSASNCMQDIAYSATYGSSGFLEITSSANCQAVCSHFSYGNFTRGIDTKPYGDPIWMYSSDVYCGGGYSCPAGWTLSGSNCFAPDLTAGAVTPVSATVGLATNFISTISNAVSVSTGVGFSNFFQVATAANGNGTISDLTSSTMAALASGAGATATSPSYTFTSAGTYSVRACADKSSSGNVGTITESNEGNNCGAWITVTVVAPDLAPSGGVTAGSVVAGTATTLSQNFTNSGTANTAATFPNVFQFANDISGNGAGTPVTGTTIAGLNMSQTKPSTYSWTPPAAGDYFVRACADATPLWASAVPESPNEGNNCGAWTRITAASACVVNQGSACASSANACGNSSDGTIQCNGTCSAVTPALPAGYGTSCSQTSTCGTNTGTINCSGTCSVSAPVVPANYGYTCTSPANSCGMTTSGGTILCSGACSADAPSNTLCPATVKTKYKQF